MQSFQTAPSSVLFIGATGYIGGSVLVGLLKKWPHLQWSAVVRNPKNSAAVEALGVKVVQGSNDDAALIERLASENDMVVNCSDADDVQLANAILKGLTAAKDVTPGQRKKIYLHTSGTGVVTDKPNGTLQDGMTYDDNNVEHIKTIEPDQMHRNVDLAIFEAAETSPVDTYIIAPATIYGKGIGPVKTMSQQVNDMIRTALKHGQLLFPGPGTNVWPNVHIIDLVDLYVLVFQLAVSGLNPNVGYSNFFWGSAGTHVWGDVAKATAKLLYERGAIKTPEVKSVPLDEVPELSGLAANSRTVANRSFALGWKPHHPTLEEELPGEVDRTVEEYQSKETA